MNLSKRVTKVAIVLVAMSAINILITQLAGTTQHIGVQLVRFAFTLIIASYLARGQLWARWLSVVLLGFGGIMSVVSFFSLFERAFAAAPGRMLWLLFMGVIFTAIAAYLALSKKVAAECALPSEPPIADSR